MAANAVLFLLNKVENGNSMQEFSKFYFRNISAKNTQLAISYGLPLQKKQLKTNTYISNHGLYPRQKQF